MGKKGKEEGEPTGGDGRARLHADVELAIWSSGRGRPWLLAEQNSDQGDSRRVPRHGCCTVEAVGHGRQRARREVELSSLLHAVWKKTGRKRRRWRLGG